MTFTLLSAYGRADDWPSKLLGLKVIDLVYDLLFVIESIVLVFWRLDPTASAFWMSSTALVALVLLLLSARSKKSTDFIVRSIIYMCILSVLLFLGGLYMGRPVTFGSLAFWVTGVLLAICIAANPPSVWSARLALVLIMAGLVFFVARNGYNMFPSVSENYASVFCLFSYVVYAVSCEADRNEHYVESLVLAFFVVLTSLFAKGRGGILSSMVLLLLLLIVCLAKSDRGRRQMLLLVSLAIIALCAIILIGNSESLSRFSASDAVASHSTEKRLGMLGSYLNASTSTVQGFIFGVDTLTVPNAELTRVAGNLHNSFFQTHSVFGLLGLVVLFLSLYHALKDSLKAGHYIFGTAVVAFMMRAATDTVFPLETGSVVMALLIVYTLHKLPLPSIALERCLYASRN